MFAFQSFERYSPSKLAGSQHGTAQCQWLAKSAKSWLVIYAWLVQAYNLGSSPGHRNVGQRYRGYSRTPGLRPGGGVAWLSFQLGPALFSSPSAGRRPDPGHLNLATPYSRDICCEPARWFSPWHSRTASTVERQPRNPALLRAHSTRPLAAYSF